MKQWMWARRAGIDRRRTTALHAAARLEPLEPRRLLSAGEHEETFERFMPPPHRLWNVSGYLSEPAPGSALTVAMDYLRAHARELGLQPTDLAEVLVTDEYTEADTGVTHIHLRQKRDGLEITNANLNINVARDGRVISVGSSFVGGASGAGGKLAVAAATAPGLLRPEQALAQAAVELGLEVPSVPRELAAAGFGANDAVMLAAPAASLDPVPAKLRYTWTPGGVELVWGMVLRTPDGEHWYDLNIDAHTGHIVERYDWVHHASYRVFPRPVDSPGDGVRALLSNPHDPLASPFGWHDTDGLAGAEFTDTRGNNVFAQEDRNDDDKGGNRPDGGRALSFDFPLELGQNPIASEAAAITNLFYWNNLAHDVFYRYGFTESAGNFQFNNYGHGGEGGDQVIADAQDGSGVNNANFATPPDGQSPRMQMYNFTQTFPLRDGDLESQIIIHEYGHGVSTRLTGGAANSNSLNGIQSGAMGEGWSDWFGLMFNQRSSDVRNQGFTLGNWVLGQSQTNGSGIRRFPYSFNMSINPLTLDDFNDSAEVHDAGEIWCSTLWDLNWLLIERYGFEEDITRGYLPGGGGNALAMRLVMDALKLQPVNPSFLDGRNAVLQADTVLTGGENHDLIWQAFARRGLGVSASIGEDANSTTVIEAFDLPWPEPLVLSSRPAGAVVGNQAAVTIYFNEPMDTSSFSLEDVSGFTGPDGVDLRSALTGFRWLDAQTLRIEFAEQFRVGSYKLSVGPAILAADNRHAMDQDRDAIVGESVEDQYTASFEIDPCPGPDGFGYEACAASFVPIDLVPGGAGVTSLADGVDDAFGLIPLGQNTFNFYGTVYTGDSGIFASSNGMLTLGSGSAAFTNTDLTRGDEAMIAVLWDDWVTDASDAGAGNDVILWRLDTAENRLIIEWNNVRNFNGPESNGATFQVILELNTGDRAGMITLNYPDTSVGAASLDNGGSATVGIKGPGNQGIHRLLISKNDPAHPLVATGRAIQISAGDPPPHAQIAEIKPDPRNTPVSQIRIMFSEPVTGFDLSDLRFTRDGGAENLLTSEQMLTSADGVTWTLSDIGLITSVDGAYELVLRREGSGIRDSAGLGLIGQARDSFVVDFVAPVVTVRPTTAEVFSPRLTGTVNDATAEVIVTVGELSYTAENNGDGTWTLPAGAIDPPLSNGTYDLRVRAVDPAGNEGVDATSDELIVHVIPGEMHGVKFLDGDGDGEQDAGELPLSGWTIYLDANLNQRLDAGESQTVTDENGAYSFTGLVPGVYSVQEVLRPGWSQTFPVTQARLFAVLADGSEQIAEIHPVTGDIIRQFKAPESTSAGADGLAYDGRSLFYINGQGSRRLWELDPDTGMVRDLDEINAGSKEYDGLAALNGLIYIQDYARGDLVIFDPKSDQVVGTLNVDGLNDDVGPLGGAAGITGPDAIIATSFFGEDVVEIDPKSGKVTSSFIPKRATYYGVATVGGQIYLSTPSPGTIDVYGRSGALVRELQVDGGFSALAGDGIGVLPRTIIIKSGSIERDVHFGNRPTDGVVQGMKWNDLDSDGVRDLNESGLGGWEIYADLNNNGQHDTSEPSAVTAADGRYTLTVSGVGRQVVREIPRAGWQQTFPSAGVHEVVIVLGEVVSGVDFGNHIDPPAAPTNLKVKEAPSRITLTWETSAFAEAYNVKRSLVGGQEEVVFEGIVGTRFVDSTAVTGNTYRYSVSATNLGGEGLDSQSLLATARLTAPDAPLNVRAVPGPDRVTLSWDESEFAETYTVRRRSASGAFMVIGSNLTAISFTDLTASAGIDYFYAVSATNAAGEGEQSEAIAARLTPPPAPLDVTAAGRPGEITLAWSPSIGATSYSIRRSTASGQQMVIAAGIVGTGYVDRNVLDRVEYFYTISAVSASGEGPNSEQVRAVPSVDGIPIPWESSDIGGPTSPGAATQANGIYTLTSTGRGLSGEGDQFRFVYQRITGNVVITARIPVVQGGAGLDGAALMMRQSLHPDAPFFLVNLTAGERVLALYREQAGQDPLDSADVDARPWIRLVRQGNTFSAFVSADGVSFTRVAEPRMIPMGSEVLVGMAALAFSPTPQITVSFKDVSVVVPPVAPDLTAEADDGVVRLSWTPVPGARGYKISRSTSLGTGIPFTTVGANVVSFEDPAINGQQRYYTVTAFNEAGDGQRSNEVAAIPTSGIRIIDGTTGPDIFHVRLAASAIEIWLNSPQPGLAPPTLTLPYDSFSALTFRGGAGDDELHIDRTEADGLSGFPISWYGGLHGQQGDLLSVTGGAADDEITLNDAEVVFNFASILPFGTERLQISGGEGDDQITVQTALHLRPRFLPSGGTDTISINAGTIRIDHDLGVGSNVRLNVRLNAEVQFAANQTLASLSLSGQSRARLIPGKFLLNLKALSLRGLARLDLADGRAIIDKGPLAQIRQWIVSGRGTAPGGVADGRWDGSSGITSSAAAARFSSRWHESGYLGFSVNGAMPLGQLREFAGVAVDDDDLLIAFTRTGDVDLDGRVTNRDVTILAGFYRSDGSDGDPIRYPHEGDMNYDGVVNNNDITIAAGFFNPSISVDDETLIVSPVVANGDEEQTMAGIFSSDRHVLA